MAKEHKFVDIDSWFLNLQPTEKCWGEGGEFSFLLARIAWEKQLGDICIPQLVLVLDLDPTERLVRVRLGSGIGAAVRTYDKKQVNHFLSTSCPNQPLIAIALWIILGDDRHVNTLVVNRDTKEYERFEPHGEFEVLYVDDIVNHILKTNIDIKQALGLEDYMYIPPLNYCPRAGPQALENETEEEKKRCQHGGFCATWSIYYALARITNPYTSREDIISYMIKPEKEKNLNTKIRKFETYLGQVYKYQPLFKPTKTSSFRYKFNIANEDLAKLMVEEK
jgi:hypothetical protein